MSVLVKGMKMPQNCTICRFCVPEADPENGEMCMATGKYVPPCNTDRLENCPLVEVPTPHGRLIDADKLDRAFSDLRWQDGDWQTGEMVHWGDRSDWCLQGIEVETLIKNAPTIIEAEEGEDDE